VSDGPETDKGSPVVVSPAKPHKDDDGTKEARERHRKSNAGRLQPNGGHRVEDPAVNSSTANCHGTTFDESKTEIAEEQVQAIIDHNYTHITRPAAAKVCCVVVYGDPKKPRHSALIVEVDANGDPTFVVGKDGGNGELWAHPPGNFGDDWQVYCRTTIPDDRQAEVARLQKAYDDAAAAYTAASNQANREALHKKGYELCRTKNALRHRK